MEPLPEDIKRFLELNIDSIEQLEILRILGENPSKEWDLAALAREVQALPAAVAAHVAVLQSRSLISVATQGADPSCCYGPGSPELEWLVTQLLQLYRERPVTLIRMVYDRAKGKAPLKDFSDAFRIRKEE